MGVSAGSVALAAPRPGSAAVAANDKIRLGLIGAGSRGNQLLDTFLARPDVDFVAVADVDDRHAARDRRRGSRRRGATSPATSRDYRAMLDAKDLDAVVIATPDHWHALPVDRGRAGGQGRLRREADRPQRRRGAGDDPGRPEVRARSWPSAPSSAPPPHFQKAVEIVRSGKLGKVFWVQTWNFENISPVGMGTPPRHRGARRTSITTAGSARRPSGRSTRTASTCSSAGSSTTPAA